MCCLFVYVLFVVNYVCVFSWFSLSICWFEVLQGLLFLGAGLVELGRGVLPEALQGVDDVAALAYYHYYYHHYHYDHYCY